MQKNEVYRNHTNIYRILQIQDERALVIDCVKKTMPTWKLISELDRFSLIDEETLFEELGYTIEDINEVEADRKKVMYQRYSNISGIVPFIGCKQRRNEIISAMALESGLSKQTLRSYLCEYLVFQNINALLPRKKNLLTKKLSEDEKNMRWSLNKYFYSHKKNTLKTAYTMMLKEKYCDIDGVLFDKYPSFYQYRYFYRKTRKMQNYYISRNGLTSYQRNNRPCVGDGVHSFANTIGTGMVDSTVCDIYLANEHGQVIGRPILTACVDTFSGICYGYSLGWEGGVYSLREMCHMIITNKADYCKKYGIEIQEDEWDVSVLPFRIVSDQGAEYVGSTFEQLSELGITIVNLPAYRPELKGPVEKFFDTIQSSYKKYLKGYGVIETDYQERGAHDYRKDAIITLDKFSRIVLRCVLHYNGSHVLENYPFTDEMLANGVKPYANAIWNYEKANTCCSGISVSKEKLTLCLLPRTTGRFTRFGLIVNQMRYHNSSYTEKYLTGGEVIVAFDEDSVSNVWLVEEGNYIRFKLIETRYDGKNLNQVRRIKGETRRLISEESKVSLQAEIDLANDIQVVVNDCKSERVPEIKHIRQHRDKEKAKNHTRFAEEVGLHD